MIKIIQSIRCQVQDIIEEEIERNNASNLEDHDRHVNNYSTIHNIAIDQESLQGKTT